jgi:transcriptional regulator with XRE-family HTH domain
MSALKQLRKQVGLTQVELAKRIPNKTGDGTIEQSSISHWERGLKQPELTVLQMKALCRALKVSLEELPDYFG